MVQISGYFFGENRIKKMSDKIVRGGGGGGTSERTIYLETPAAIEDKTNCGNKYFQDIGHHVSLGTQRKFLVFDGWYSHEHFVCNYTKYLLLHIYVRKGGKEVYMKKCREWREE